MNKSNIFVNRFKCNQCQAFSYRLNDTTCRKCRCNIFGSKDQICDENGQCLCLKNAMGLKCDICKTNTFNITVGCIPCPKCYDLVKTEIENLELLIVNKTNVIDKVEKEIDKEYVTIDKKKLFYLKHNISMLKINATNVRLNQINNDKVLKLVKNLDNVINSLELIKYDMKTKHKPNELKNLITQVNNEMNTINDFIDKLKRAINKVQVDSNKAEHLDEEMKKIKDNAFRLGEIFEREVNKIENNVKKTQEECKNTCEISKDIKKNQEKLTFLTKDFESAIKKTDIEGIKKLIKKIASDASKSKTIAEVDFHKANNRSVPSNVTGINDIKNYVSKLEALENDEDDFRKKIAKLKDKFKIIKDTEIKVKSSVSEIENIGAKIDADLKDFKGVLENARDILNGEYKKVAKKIMFTQ